MNLNKTELYPINSDGAAAFAYTFHCKVGRFPLQYLGLPLKDRKLCVDDWHFLLDKVEKRLQHWK